LRRRGCATVLPADPLNCGTCGNSCTTGATCEAGVCTCAPGQIVCGGACVDVSSDEANCGMCGHDCPTCGTCTSGVCQCAGGLLACGGACVDVSSDARNCGMCGSRCFGGTACVSGACSCPSPLVMAGGRCIDVTHDLNNCGSAGHRCNDTEYCVSGACVCRPGLTDVAADLEVQILPQAGHCKGSEAQGREGDRPSGGSVERSRGKMDKNRIRGAADRVVWEGTGEDHSPPLSRLASFVRGPCPRGSS